MKCLNYFEIEVEKAEVVSISGRYNLHLDLCLRFGWVCVLFGLPRRRRIARTSLSASPSLHCSSLNDLVVAFRHPRSSKSKLGTWKDTIIYFWCWHKYIIYCMTQHCRHYTRAHWFLYWPLLAATHFIQSTRLRAIVCCLTWYGPVMPLALTTACWG